MRDSKKIFLSFIILIFIIITAKDYDIQKVNLKNNYLFIASRLRGQPYFCPDYPDYCLGLTKEIGDYIKTQTTKEDPIQLWALDLGIYLYSDRIQATKFATPIGIWVAQGKLKQRFYQEFYSDLEKKLPKFFIVDNYNRKLGDVDKIDDDIYNYKELIKYIESNYIKSNRIENYDIYTRNYF